jgi:hypothetical protein
MARLKRSSAVLETARKRLAGLKSLKTAPNLGPDLTDVSYEADITALEGKIAAYNERLASLDPMLNEIQSLETGLSDKSSRILAGVGVERGKDSDEYEQVGGTRKSERKRPGPRKPGGSGSPKP